MGTIALGQHQIGFWMAERTAAPEIPPGITAQHEGVPVPGGSTLVVVGGQDGVARWAVCLHEREGASLVLIWDERLLVAVGGTARVLDEFGTVLIRRSFEEELLSAWRTANGLLIFTRRGARLVNSQLEDIWTAPVEADGFQPLDLEGEGFRVAAMRAEGWDELWIDARTGAIEVRA
jgi:hypothetical protein